MYFFLTKFFKDLNKFHKLKTQKEKTQNKKKICMIQLQNYILNCKKHILMNAINNLMRKEKI